MLLALEPGADSQAATPTVQLKIADFGQARLIPKERPNPQLSLEVGTKWYKAPEILYGIRDYSEKVDMWSIGCILAELLDHTPLFTGASDFDQLARIARFIGAPSAEDGWFVSDFDLICLSFFNVKS